MAKTKKTKKEAKKQVPSAVTHIISALKTPVAPKDIRTVGKFTGLATRGNPASGLRKAQRKG